MNKGIINVMLVAVVSLIAFSCNNAELESRISDLEGRVAALESKGGSPISSNAAQAPQVEVEEVKPDGPLPAFKFDEELHNFGTIKQGDQVEHIFTFTNVGDAPLLINSAQGSCGCTVPQWPREEIPVGGTGEIKVSFNSKGRKGIQNKTVTINANTYPKATRIKIQAEVQVDEASNPS